MTNLSKFRVEVFAHYFEKIKLLFWGETLNNFETLTVYFEISLFFVMLQNHYSDIYSSHFIKMLIIILDSNSLL